MAVVICLYVFNLDKAGTGHKPDSIYIDVTSHEQPALGATTVPPLPKVQGPSPEFKF